MDDFIMLFGRKIPRTKLENEAVKRLDIIWADHCPTIINEGSEESIRKHLNTKINFNKEDNN